MTAVPSPNHGPRGGHGYSDLVLPPDSERAAVSVDLPPHRGCLIRLHEANVEAAGLIAHRSASKHSEAGIPGDALVDAINKGGLPLRCFVPGFDSKPSASPPTAPCGASPVERLALRLSPLREPGSFPLPSDFLTDR